MPQINCNRIASSELPLVKTQLQNNTITGNTNCNLGSFNCNIELLGSPATGSGTITKVTAAGSC